MSTKWSILNYATTGVLAVLLMNATAFTADIDWDAGGTDDNWSTTDNWDPAQVPGEDDDVLLNDAVAGDQELYLDIDAGISNLTLESTAGTNYTLTTGSNTGEHTLTLGGNISVASGKQLTLDAPVLKETPSGPMRAFAEGDLIFNRSFGVGQGLVFRIHNGGTVTFNSATGLDQIYAEDGPNIASGGTLVLAHQDAINSAFVGLEDGVTSYNLDLATDAMSNKYQGLFSGGGSGELNVRVHEGDADRVLTLTAAVQMVSSSVDSKIVLTNAADGGDGKVTLRSYHSGATSMMGNVEIQAGHRLLVDGPGTGNSFFVHGQITGSQEGTVEVAAGSEILFDGESSVLTPGISGVTIKLNTEGSEQARIDLAPNGTGVTEWDMQFGTITGEGEIDLDADGKVTIVDKLSPGNSTGTLRITAGDSSGSFTLADTSVSVFELSIPADANDQVIIENDADLVLGGTLTIENLGGLEAGQTFILFDSLGNGTTTGEFDQIVMPEGFYATAQIDGNDVLLNVIPEPGSLLSLIVGASLLATSRKRLV